jgi:H+-translocating NAD(P) transhydrogenase subunit beta
MWTNLAYLLAAILFIFGIKGLTSPRTAVRGNLTSAAGMLLAVVATLVIGNFNWWIILGGLAVGAFVGAVVAIRIQMTAMPQMVALLNGFGGGASVLVAGVAGAAAAWALRQGVEVPVDSPYPVFIATALSGLIGAVTFCGSLVAFGKLQELDLFRHDLRLPGHQLISIGLLLIALAMAGLVVIRHDWLVLFYALLIVAASALGVMLVVRIGGADMPVVISLLNSYSGLAAAAAGFVIRNNVLIIAGSLVGASGIILTMIMCRAMNRSLANVLFGGIDAGKAAPADDVYAGRIKSTTAEEIGPLLADARRVVIVPGYGMAVSQAQFAVRDLYRQLMDRGVDVLFAIHPVAGRMPGHMNVLLAEVEIPYERLVEMETINPQFRETDVAIVLGANDVVNPDARTNPASPIAGMPILNVDEARTVIVVKRSLSPGFAGIPNPLFAADNALMFFADGKKAVLDIVNALKEI